MCVFVGGFSCLCLLSPVARTHAARPHRDWRMIGSEDTKEGSKVEPTSAGATRNKCEGQSLA